MRSFVPLRSSSTGAAEGGHRRVRLHVLGDVPWTVATCRDGGDIGDKGMPCGESTMELVLEYIGDD